MISKTRRAATGTVRMLVDTCVWLDLAKQADGGNIVAALEELLSKGKIELIVPQIVIDEFERNRSRVQETMTRSVSSRFRDVRKVISEHGRSDDKQKVLAEIDNIAHQVPIVNELAAQAFDAILKLLRSRKAITATPKMKHAVIERALTKQAPFHSNKNSTADALLIEMYREAAKTATATDRYCFITHNKTDFSSSNGDERHPHSDFVGIFSSPRSRYFISLQTALVTYLPREMEDLDFELNFYEEPRALSEVLPYLGKLEDQIWYNRHKNREYRIEIGEVKVVEKWDREIAQHTIVRSVWQGALESALKLEVKYGLDELGPWDDFEWGMINGKLSAIRWMLGEDWESSLDI